MLTPARLARSLRAAPAYGNCHYWLDIGNNADSGQFVLGQPDNRHSKDLHFRLPTVADLFPEIINSKMDKQDRLPSCSAIEALQRQEPFVNQTLAYQSLAMLARLFRHGRLSYHAGFLNLVTGRMSSLAVNSVGLAKSHLAESQAITRTLAILLSSPKTDPGLPRARNLQ